MTRGILLRAARFSLVFIGMTAAAVSAAAQPIDVILPTENHAIFSESPEEFYQRTVRKNRSPWKGGMYGYVRNARRIGDSIVFTRFHEGVDIRPVHRDRRGRPLDSVVVISDGTVVHVNAVAGYSNYGKYIVVEHNWGGSPYYSLYAHLNDVWVETGDKVLRGDPLGLLGYTGAGINRARAHLHLEICLLVSEQFQFWYDSVWAPGDANRHGIYNGRNLAGINVAAFYAALQADPQMTMPEFLAQEPVAFTVQVPRTAPLDILRRYPWLLTRSAQPEDGSWKISFAASGVPLQVEPALESVTEPTVIHVLDLDIPARYRSKYMLRGSGTSRRLSASGKRYIELLMTTGFKEEVPRRNEPRVISVPGEDDEDEME